ncbi:MAG: hypothetical protein CMJ64_28865 [Planctomycetaceae bacterium]|nr:hypothetical protein [Planctomycetaceae bacterium]
MNVNLMTKRKLTGLLAAVIVVSGIVFSTSRRATSQEGAEDSETVVEIEIPLIEREPFDVIILDEANRNYRAEVFLLPFPQRRPPPPDKRKGDLRVRLLFDDSMEWDVAWQHITQVILFEQMLFDQATSLKAEAKKLIAAKKYLDAGEKLDEAYHYLLKMQVDYPRYPRLGSSVDEFLYLDSGNLYLQKRFAEALNVMEQLYERNPTYNNSLLPGRMGTLVDEIVKGYLDQKDFRSARIVLDRLADKYQDKRPVQIDYWRKELDRLASEHVAIGRKALEEKRYREAVESVRLARDVSPTSRDARELEIILNDTYPQIVVGVTQPALTYDSERIDDWAARRTGRLVHRSLIEFLGPGNEGGEYQFPGGTIERSPNGRQLTFRLNQFAADNVNVVQSGYVLSQRLLDLANPKSTEYRSAWSSLITGVSIDNVLRVDVDSRRSHVLPEALLRVPMSATLLPDGTPAKDGTGSFRVDLETETDTVFMLKDFQPGTRLAELIERHFENANGALNALRRGRIDVIDRLFPSDAARLEEQLKRERNPDLVLQQYSLPTVHTLIPKSDHPFLANRKFRRALAFGIDRHRILGEDLLGGRVRPGCQVISGPFPLGLGQDDPLAYAYDETLEARVWRPRLAKLLLILAENELTTKAELLKEEPPKLTPLLLAHPATESSRVACQAIKAHLAIIDIEIKIKELPVGMTTDPDDECDLLYTEIAIWEPVSDARKLLGPGGVAATDSPFVQQALRWLDRAENWGDVREQLVALHHAVHNEVSLIPLWQTTDYFVYNKRLRNLGESPVWLYQNVDQWRLQAEVAERQ